MTSRNRRVIPALFAGALVSGAGIASAAEPSQQDLMAQIDALKAKVEALETKQVASQDVDATVASVLADADRRSQLLQADGGLQAGHEKGKFFLRSADGNFYLNPNFQLQVRHVATYAEGEDDFDSDDDDTWEKGFEIRRMKFAFEGHAFTPDLTYKFQWETFTDGGVDLEDAWLRYKFADQMAVRLGQFKDPTFHEESVSSKRQLAADRSLVNEVLAGGETDYIQAIELIYTSDNLRGEVGYSDGVNSDNTDFRDPPEGNSNFGFFGRVDFLASGDWRQYDDFTAMGNKEDLLVIGAGVHWDQTGDLDLYYHTVDLQWENAGGLGAYVAYYGRYVEVGDDDFYDWGGLGQLGFMLNEKWEIFGRVDYIKLDISSDEDDFWELTAGLNYYMYGHNLKFTGDVGWLPEGSPEQIEGIGVLGGDEDQFYLRLQVQLLI